MSRKGLLGATLAAFLTLGGVVAPAALAQDADTTTTADSGDDTGLWGLAGLLGLAGLAGLKRRDRYETRPNEARTYSGAA